MENFYEKFEKRLSSENKNFIKNSITGDPVRIYNIIVNRVPAYKKFLSSLYSEIPEIKSLGDFHNLPLTDKTNYINKFPINELCLDGTFTGKHIIYLSSGTTLRSTPWPNIGSLEKFAPLWLYNQFEANFNISFRNTLIVIALPIGPWISGGLITWSAQSLASELDNITLITPGFQIEEVLEALEIFSPYFEQTILIGYPPFTKKIIEQACDAKLPIKKYNIRLMLVGEGYSERFRDYMKNLLGHKESDITSIWSVYGSADFGVLGEENMLTILIRNMIYKKNLAYNIFGEDEIPSICQFDPNLFYLEELNNELVISRIQGIPLARYRTGDRGKVMLYKDFALLLKKNGINLSEMINENKLRLLPFVFIYGRLMDSVKFYGINIRAEKIKEVLENNNLLFNNFTGNFHIKVKVHENMDPSLEIYLEKKHQTELNSEKIAQIVSEELAKRHNTYKIILNQMKNKVIPRIILVENDFFKSKKMKYVEQDK